MDLIAHPSATIVQYAYYLVIDQVKFRHTELFDAMLLRLPCFDFVHILELRNIRWYKYQVPSVDRLISAFKRVTDVRIYFLTFNNPTDLWSMVARFPSLQRLSVTSAAFFSTKLPFLLPALDVADTHPHLSPPKIHNLVLSETLGHQTHILEWFSSHGTLVDSVSVDLESVAWPSLNRYLHVLGPALLFLQIDVGFGLPGAFSSLFSTHQALLTRF
jgi:hypothetical protein